MKVIAKEEKISNRKLRLLIETNESLKSQIHNKQARYVEVYKKINHAFLEKEREVNVMIMLIRIAVFKKGISKNAYQVTKHLKEKMGTWLFNNKPP